MAPRTTGIAHQNQNQSQRNPPSPARARQRPPKSDRRHGTIQRALLLQQSPPPRPPLLLQLGPQLGIVAVNCRMPQPISPGADTAGPAARSEPKPAALPRPPDPQAPHRVPMRPDA